VRPAFVRPLIPSSAKILRGAFALPHQDGVDLRALPLTERKRDLQAIGSSDRSEPRTVGDVAGTRARDQ
jgi:ATP-dependent DNA ligase